MRSSSKSLPMYFCELLGKKETSGYPLKARPSTDVSVRLVVRPELRNAWSADSAAVCADSISILFRWPAWHKGFAQKRPHSRSWMDWTLLQKGSVVSTSRRMQNLLPRALSLLQIWHTWARHESPGPQNESVPPAIRVIYLAVNDSNL